MLCYPPPNLAPFLPRILPSGHRNIRGKIENFLEGIRGILEKMRRKGLRNAKKEAQGNEYLEPLSGSIYEGDLSCFVG